MKKCFLDLRLKSNHPSIKEAARAYTKLMKEYDPSLVRDINQTQANEFFLLNGITSLEYDYIQWKNGIEYHQPTFIYLPTSGTSYTELKKRQEITWGWYIANRHTATRFRDFGIDNDYLYWEEPIITIDHKEFGAFRATEKLVDFVHSFEFPYDSLYRDGVNVVLKDENKKRIPLPKTREIQRMIKDVEEYNEFARNFGVTLDRSKTNYQIESWRRTLYRVFNNSSMKLGGRWYGGWWQNIPSDQRRYILFDNKYDVEWDIKCCLITSLYHSAGINRNDDFYLIPGRGESYRDIVKKATTIMLNCESPPKATGAILKAIYTELTEEEQESWRRRGVFTHDEIKRLLAEIEAANQDIKHEFYKSTALRMQFKDSEICRRVLKKSRRAGLLVLPVHDSFICSHDHEQEMKDIIVESWGEEFGKEFKPSLHRD